jgi:hypothetical protein
MVIESKYDIGQEIWDVYRNGKEIIVRKDKIVEVIYNVEKGILYMMSVVDEIEEEKVIAIENVTGLAKKIIELQREIDDEEKRSKY